MAKCNPMMGPMSGSMGGCTWSRNKGGQYLRIRSIPTNPQTVKQTTARTLFGNASGNWSGVLTAFQRSQWNAWAAANPIVDSLGQVIQMSGQQAYVQMTVRLFAAGQTAPSTPPTTVAPALPVIGLCGYTHLGLASVVFSPTPLAAGILLQVFYQPPHLAGQHPNFQGAILLATSAAAAASPFTAGGLPGAAGQTVDLWIRALDASGQVSALQHVTVTVV